MGNTWAANDVAHLPPAIGMQTHVPSEREGSSQHIGSKMREMPVRKRHGHEWEEFPLIHVHASTGLHKSLGPFSPH